MTVLRSDSLEVCVSRSLRVDFAGPVQKTTILPDGSLLVPGYITRTGVFVYKYSDGQTVREYRPPEEVFSVGSMESFDDVALTEGHPMAPVMPDNWSAVARGHIDSPRKDGVFVAADCIVKDANTIAKIVQGELVELSCGYFAEIDPTPGFTPEGEAYDQIQRNIVGNHVAIGPKDWGRAGEDVRLYASDSTDEPRNRVAISDGYYDDMTIRVDSTQVARKDAPDAPAATTVVSTEKVIPFAEYEKVCAQRDAAIASLEQAKQSATSEDSRMLDRVSIRVAAHKIDSKISFLKDDKKTIKSDRDVMIETIRSVDSKFTGDGRSDDYVRARFDIACETPARADARSNDPHVANLAAGFVPPAESTTQARDDGDMVGAARRKMLDRNQKLSRGEKV